MRIRLEFKINRPITTYYRLGVLAIIKEMIHEGSSAYYEEIFERNKRNMKPFCYGVYIPDIEIKGPLIYGKGFHVTISSNSEEFIFHLINGAAKGDVYKIGNCELKLVSRVLLPKRPAIHSDVVTFKTLSPIHIEAKNGNPVTYKDESFDREIAYLSKILLESLEGRKPKQEIRVLQKMLDIRVIKENLHQVQGKPLILTANHGLIQLQGDPDDLQIIYTAGLSFRRALGMGLLDVVKEVN